MKNEEMQNQLNNQLAMQQVMHNMNLYNGNSGLYQNQSHYLGSGNNFNTLNNLQNNSHLVPPSSNNNLPSTIFMEGSSASYKQYLKNSKGSNHMLNDSNNSLISGVNTTSHHHSYSQQNHNNVAVSQFKNNKIIIKHANIVKKKRQIKIWTNDEDDLLKQLCEQYPGKWNDIALQIPSRNASQCSQRWRRILPTKIRKPWTSDEDQKVIELSEKYGKNWGMIAQHIEGKTGKQVRERYINKLDPSIKRIPWTEEEDQRILDMFLEQGPKWSAISNELTGRPENTVKNRFYSHISRIYLSDDNSFITHKNDDNKQKIKDACSKLPHLSNVKKSHKHLLTQPSPFNPSINNNTSNHPVPPHPPQEDIEEEEEEDDDDNIDDEDGEGEDEDDDEQDQDNNNHRLDVNISQNADPFSFPANQNHHLNRAINAASHNLAIETANKKKNQVKPSSTNGLIGSQQLANPIADRKNLKIEDQEDQDEELLEINPHQEQEEQEEQEEEAYKQRQENVKNNGGFQNHPQNQQELFHTEKELLNRRNNGFTLGRLNTISAHNLDAHSGEKSPQQQSSFSLIANPMLAKRGKIIKNIEIPKTTTSTNSHSNNLNHNNPLHLQTNDSENILTGMGMISATNLDFLNTQTPMTSYYQNLGMFPTSQYTPLYTSTGLNQHYLMNSNSLQTHMNQQSATTNHETTSPMFVLSNNLNSPTPRQTLPLFKPPMSAMGNTTPSAITPLMPNNYNQYLVYAPHHSSLGMLTPGIFPTYNQMLNPFYIKAQQTPTVFPAISKITTNANINANTSIPNPNPNFNVSDVNEKSQVETGESNSQFSQIVQQNNGFNNNQDMIQNYGILQNTHYSNNMIESNQERQNEESNKNVSVNQQNMNNEKINTSLDQCLQQQDQNEQADSQRKFQLDHLLKEFSSLDSEARKRFQMMIQGQSQEKTSSPLLSEYPHQSGISENKGVKEQSNNSSQFPIKDEHLHKNSTSDQ